MKIKPKDPVARFWLRVDKSGPNGCWLWMGHRQKSGHGRFKMNHGRVLAHRFSWELHHGPIPAGLFVCHHCDNPCCVNPAHLFLGTAADNVADCVRKGRHAHGDTHPSRTRPECLKRGSEHHYAKLKEADVLDIRSLSAEGMSRAEIARRFGVTHDAIARIVKRETWVHI